MNDDDTGFNMSNVKKIIGDDDVDLHLREGLQLAPQIYALLAGKPYATQAAALADVISMFIAGHAPELRKETFERLMASAQEMVPASEAQLFAAGMLPKEWLEQ
jgi:hypothetical protein